jgi:hypothetical protein
MVYAVIDALVAYDSSGDHIDNVAYGAKEPHAREKCERCRIEDALPGWGKKVLAEKKRNAAELPLAFFAIKAIEHWLSMTR